MTIRMKKLYVCLFTFGFVSYNVRLIHNLNMLLFCNKYYKDFTQNRFTVFDVFQNVFQLTLKGKQSELPTEIDDSSNFKTEKLAMSNIIIQSNEFTFFLQFISTIFIHDQLLKAETHSIYCDN